MSSGVSRGVPLGGSNLGAARLRKGGFPPSSVEQVEESLSYFKGFPLGHFGEVFADKKVEFFEFVHFWCFWPLKVIGRDALSSRTDRTQKCEGSDSKTGKSRKCQGSPSTFFHGRIKISAFRRHSYEKADKSTNQRRTETDSN